MSNSIVTRLLTRLRGAEVGRDAQGNIYYRDKKGGGFVQPDSLRKERRWVVYAGEVEASRVPPEWHAWLHHTTDEVPPKEGIARRPWMREHRPNVSGTQEAYRPPGHTLAGAQRPRTTGDYEAWSPE